MLTSKDIATMRHQHNAKARIICFLWDKGGIYPLDLICKDLKMEKSYVRHHIRESYFLDCEKGVVRLVPRGKDDDRHYSNPSDAPDVTSFMFSLCMREDLTYKQAMAQIYEFCSKKGFQSSAALKSDTSYYTAKKEARIYREAKGL